MSGNYENKKVIIKSNNNSYAHDDFLVLTFDHSAHFIISVLFTSSL